MYKAVAFTCGENIVIRAISLFNDSDDAFDRRIKIAYRRVN
jgi:hypothetical protein